MKKTELLFVVIILLFLQQVLFPPHRELKIVDTSENREIKTLFEESNCFPSIFGDINPGQNLISVCESITNFSPHSKFKNLQSLLSYTSTQCSLILANSLIFGSSFYRLTFIPIYLQLENFRL